MSRDDFKSFDEADCLFRTSKGKVRSVPPLPEGTRVADAHCHLGMLERPGLAIARAAHHGFGLLVCILDPGAEPADDDTPADVCLQRLDAWLDDARGLLAAWGEGDTPLPHVRFAVGVHPHNAKHFERVEGATRALLKDPRVSCVGEIGLDYHYDLSPRDVQRDVFARQLHIAEQAGLPVELHLREAHADALDILRAEGVPAAGCIVHCFNLDAAALEPFLELGCFVSFGGPLTFRKSHDTRQACLLVPPQRLLTETDAPFMAPEPLRGTVCDPAQTLFTLRMLLDCFGYAGREAADKALQPRPSDLAAGAEPFDTDAVGFLELQRGMTEAQFCARVYANAAELLDGAPSAWQLA